MLEKLIWNTWVIFRSPFFPSRCERFHVALENSPRVSVTLASRLYPIRRIFDCGTNADRVSASHFIQSLLCLLRRLGCLITEIGSLWGMVAVRLCRRGSCRK